MTYSLRVPTVALLLFLSACASVPTRGPGSQANPDACVQYGFPPLAAHEQLDIEKLELRFLLHYRQLEYKLDDPLGDFVLANAASLLPKFAKMQRKDPKELAAYIQGIKDVAPCGQQLFHVPPLPEVPYDRSSPWMAPAEEIEVIRGLNLKPATRGELAQRLQSGKLYLEGHGNPYKIDRMAEMFLEVVKQGAAEGIQPSFGQPHIWNPEVVRKHKKDLRPWLALGKVLAALAIGDSAKYLVSGKEKALEEWLLSKPYRSVTLDQAFLETYRIAAGDLYITLLTLENVLSRYWKADNRANVSTNRRLATIIRTFGGEGDIFGAWYHFFGLMLYSYVDGATKAKSIQKAEALTSQVLGHGQDEKQEDYVNRVAASLGERLRKDVARKKHLEPRHPERLLPSYYLDLSEDFSARLLKLGKSIENPPTR